MWKTFENLDLVEKDERRKQAGQWFVDVQTHLFLLLVFGEERKFVKIRFYQIKILFINIDIFFSS